MYSGGEDKTARIWDLRQVMTLCSIAIVTVFIRGLGS